LTIQQVPTGGFSGAMDIYSADNFQTVTRFRNTTVNQEYQFNLAGSANSFQPPGSFGIFHATNLKWVWFTKSHKQFSWRRIIRGYYTYAKIEFTCF
jgi:hypothetical protein